MRAGAGAGLRPRRQLVVLARWPAPGRCKRRLAATIGSEPASRLQARLSAHTLAVASEAAERCQAQLVLALAGAGRRAGRRLLEVLEDRDRCALRLQGGNPVALRLQGEGSLGLRMQRQLLLAQRQGAQSVVLIGADLPALESADLQQAFALLERQPLVLGPAADGGYWLIGQRTPFQAALMAGIPWGSDQVLASTLVLAEAAGRMVSLLRERCDLDRRQDLLPWC